LHLWLSKVKLLWLAELQLKHQASSYCPLDDKTHLNVSAMVCLLADKQKYVSAEQTMLQIHEEDTDLTKVEEIAPPPGLCEELESISADIYLWFSVVYVIGISSYYVRKALS